MMGSALIFLSLHYFFVILQPLLSKFSFLINLVSRNDRFNFFLSPDLAFLTNLPCFSVDFLMVIAIITIFSCPPPPPLLLMFKPAVSPLGWWNGFHQLTICLRHNAASLWICCPIRAGLHFSVLLILLDVFIYYWHLFFSLRWRCRFIWAVVLLVWRLNAWSEWSVLWLMQMSSNESSEDADTGTLLLGQTADTFDLFPPELLPENQMKLIRQIPFVRVSF